MELEEALGILAMSEQARHFEGIDSVEDALKKVTSEIDFYKRSFLGVKEQAMKQFAEIDRLNREIEKLRKMKYEPDKELTKEIEKLRAENNRLRLWYDDYFEELNEYAEDFIDSFREFKEFMENRDKGGD